MTKSTFVQGEGECDKADSPLITTEFYVAGDSLDPDACTRDLGIEPTEIWRQKRPDLIPRTDLSAVSWIIRISKRPYYSVDEAVAEILDVIWPARQSVQEFVSKNAVDVGINCNVTIAVDRPVYELSRRTIERLADIGCEFGLDIFDYSDSDQ